MKTEIKHALYLIGLGMALVAYAHANFATKQMVKDARAARDREADSIINRLDRIEAKIDSLKD